MASSEKIIASEATIGQYIPQKPPIIMIGKLLDVTPTKTVTSLVIREDNLFCSEGFFREPGLIENMAQTAAAGTGYVSKNEKKEPPTGFIGGLRNLQIYSLPRVGCEIRTEVTIEHEVFDAKVVKGKIFFEENCIAECELKVFLIKSK
ncbi:MAG: hydroxymyristoyl-ACP dehydratase [Bacteroidales bacterium]|jgi:predicted hotdog family 3-hydroxylacyl-ACP dehydratase